MLLKLLLHNQEVVREDLHEIKVQMHEENLDLNLQVLKVIMVRLIKISKVSISMGFQMMIMNSTMGS